MNSLEQKIIERIRREGPITFETFMEMALYEPGLGYYASHKAMIGKEGDFYTSPHLHPAFGAMMGIQIEEMWQLMVSTRSRLPEEDGFHIVEIGAGEGYLCKDILDYLTKRDCFDSIIYVIVERNPSMRHKQERLLEGFLHKVMWCGSLQEVGKVKGCILSNELLDAFPVHIIEMEEEAKEIYVSVDGDRLVETEGDVSTRAIADYLNEFSIELTQGYRTEINLRIKEWLRSVDEILSEGFILTIDYGYPAREYYSEERNRGTLLCYHGHQVVENPFRNIGEQDITAHVNFSSVKKWGEALGLKTLGFCHQGAFLISLGILEMVKDQYENSPDYPFEVAKIKGLILPGTMGESHKIIVQYKGGKSPELKGFSMKNQVGRL